jgi:hypothetical protein
MVMAADGGAANRQGDVGGWGMPELGEEKRERREEGGGRSRERREEADDTREFWEIRKEVHITPTSFRFWTQHPLKFELAHLTPQTLQNRANDPLALS